MKTVILAGGLGTRISEESKPKPMVEVGDKPILWHILKSYSHYGFNDFVICLGYKGYVIKEYFANYFLHHSDITFDFKNNNSIEVHNHSSEPWKITLVDTGHDTLTGGRLLRVKKFLEKEKSFMVTYGDGVSNVNLKKLIEFHESHQKTATLTAVQPSGRFGILETTPQNLVTAFTEKPQGDGAWINGGFFVFNQEIFKHLKDDQTILEKHALTDLAQQKQLMSYKHSDFWYAMDTQRDKLYLDELWKSNKAPWKTW